MAKACQSQNITMVYSVVDAIRKLPQHGCCGMVPSIRQALHEVETWHGSGLELPPGRERGQFPCCNGGHGLFSAVAAHFPGGLQAPADARPQLRAENAAAVGTVQLNAADPGGFAVGHAGNGG